MGIEPTGGLSPGRPPVLKTGARTSGTRTPLEMLTRHHRDPGHTRSIDQSYFAHASAPWPGGHFSIFGS